MEEQEKKQREQIKFTVNNFMIPEPSEPPQNEKDNEKNIFPEIQGGVQPLRFADT